MTRLEELISDDETDELIDLVGIITLLTSNQTDKQTEGIHQLHAAISHPDTNLDDKLQAIIALYRHVPDECYEYIRVLESSFQITQTEIQQQILERLADTDELDPHIRLNCAQTILNTAIDLSPTIKRSMDGEAELLRDRQSKMFEKSYAYIHAMTEKELPILILIECCKLLFKCHYKPLRRDYRIKAVDQLASILNDSRWASEYRYELLVGISRDTRDDYKGLVDRVQITFFNNEKNGIRQRILSASYLLQHVSTLTETSKDKIIDEFISVATDENREFNVRGDAADALIISGIATGIARAVEEGQRIITRLGIRSRADTIYENRQNVHDTTIGRHVKAILNKLIEDKFPEDLTYEMVYSDVMVEVEKLPEHERELAQTALQRINVDTTIFENDFTLRDILMHVWVRVMRYPQKAVVQNFMTELVDMAETCTTGHEKRLINILATMGEAIHISFRDQIIANVKGRMLKRIKDIRDEDKKGLVLIGMACDDEFDDDRRNFSNFIIDNILQLRAELEREFVVDEQYVNPDEFDEYFGDGIRAFQSFVGDI
jgi:hypothetical protein